MTRRAVVASVIGWVGVLQATTVTVQAQTSPATLIANRIMAQGTVAEIDHKQRTMTLKLPSGDRLTLQVSPEATGFEQIKKGDSVAVDYLEAVSVSLQSSDQAVPEVAAETYRIAMPGQPDGALVSTARITATIESIDPAQRIVTLRGPAGETVRVHMPPEAGSLDRMRKGDKVTAHYTQALAIDVRKTG